MRDDYKIDLSHEEILIRMNKLKAVSSLSDIDYNNLPLSVKQSIEFTIDALNFKNDDAF